MSGITNILDIAARSLLAEQLGVEVTSHNLANVNTQGYCRQKVNYVTANPVTSPWGLLGTGVKIQGISQAFDPFITAQLNSKSSLLAYYQTLETSLGKTAALFNETEAGGINHLLSQFWEALHDLADNPSGLGERQALLARAQTLSEAFNSRAEGLVQQRLSLYQQIPPVLTEINDHAGRIAELNKEIVATEANGQQANDLRDRRQLEISQLAQLIGISTYTSGDGMVNVTLANGLPLVQDVHSYTLSAGLTPADTVEIIWAGPGGTTKPVAAADLGGKLGALVTARDLTIPLYQQKLDQLARDLLVAVNTQHSQGVGLNFFDETTGSYAVSDPDAPLSGAGLPFGDRIVSGSFELHVYRGGEHLAAASIPIDPSFSLNQVVTAINTNPVIGGYVTAAVENNSLKIVANAGTDAFAFARDDSNALMALGINTFFEGSNAYTLGVKVWVLDHPEGVAAAQIDGNGAVAAGDNRNALALAALEDAAVTASGQTLAAAYQNLVTAVGLEVERAGQQENFYQGLVEQFTQMRNSVSAVSLDEELTNLIKYQRAYQAAARLISVADELYQTLLAIRR
uniref:Flagellar hook-associated protein 1 n=1 Tax=Desulfobacca acetoxidans TaxID=60893 RepID=A0A7V4LC24_9BACT